MSLLSVYYLWINAAAIAATAILPAPMPQQFSTIAVQPAPIKTALNTKPAANPALATHWRQGIALWKTKGYAAAARHFAAIADNPAMQETGKAAFWASRSFERAGEKDLAKAYLLHAASAQGFYSIMARKQLGQRLITPQITAYAMPKWTPSGGFRLDPALIFAFAKQESNLHTQAVGWGGSIGLMQLMPSTARRMQETIAEEEDDDSVLDAAFQEPRTNLRLGQAYLQQLLQDPHVGNNLIFAAAAYNAGPGKLAQWRNATNDKDPLLFLESLPNATTKHYVMKVLANYWLYQEANGQTATTALSLANGRWAQYNGDAWQVARAR